MTPAFHLSLGVRSVAQSAAFFEGVLRGTVVHRDPSGYVNVDLYGTQITLKENARIEPALPDLHFGVNLDLGAFDDLARHVAAVGYDGVVTAPKVVDAGTALERKKMYLRCPTGYLIELKGYRRA